MARAAEAAIVVEEPVSTLVEISAETVEPDDIPAVGLALIEAVEWAGTLAAGLVLAGIVAESDESPAVAGDEIVELVEADIAAWMACSPVVWDESAAGLACCRVGRGEFQADRA